MIDIGKECITIANNFCTVLLDPNYPRVIEYRTEFSDEPLKGCRPDAEPDICIYRKTEERYIQTSCGGFETRYSAVKSGDTVTYSTSVSEGSDKAVDLNLYFTLREDGLEVGFKNVREHGDYELINVKMPTLISVYESQPTAYLVIATSSGRLIPVADCPLHERRHLIHWTEPSPLGMVYHDSLLGLLHASSPDDHLISAVVQNEHGQKSGALSVEFTYRHKAHAPAAQFVSQESSFCLIALMGDQNADGKVDWVDAAVYWHKRVPGFVHPLYEKSHVFKIYQDFPTQTQWITFDHALEIVKSISRVTDGAQLIVYLVGWQHTGHDTGYPDVWTVNQRAGGKERLLNLIQEAKKYNAIVSFHDNYDDCYPGEPGTDTDMIARDNMGNLFVGGFWGCRQSYVIGTAWYSKKYAPERAKRTVEEYGLSGSYHIDVLTSEVGRLDFRPDAPASIRDTVEGRRRIVKLFNENGCDLTSEGMVEQLIDSIHHGYCLVRGSDNVFPVEKVIPLAGLLFHGKATYSGSTTDIVLDAFHYGGTFMTDYNLSYTDEMAADNYYLVTLPASLVQLRPMWRYEEDGEHKTVYYSEDTFADLDFKDKKYQLVVDGRVVSKDYTTWVPTTENKSHVYSRAGGEITYPTPDGWSDASKIRAYDLVADKPADIQPRISGGEITVTVEARHAYRVEYGA